VRHDILLTREAHYHGRNISVRGNVWVHKANLTPPHFIHLPAPMSDKVIVV